MITSFKLIAAAVILGVCGVSMSGVMAQQQALPPVRVVQVHGDMATLLASLANTYGVTIGLEHDTQRYHQVSVSLMDATVTDVMNAIVESSKKYQYKQTGAVIDIWPLAGSNPLLETRISSFNVKDISPAEAFDRLFNLPEVQTTMTGWNLKRRAPDNPPGKLTSTKFSVNLEGVTLREALDKIAVESHLEFWVFRNYPNGFFSISSMER